jgi:Tol biopolymer transport system component
LQRVSANGGEVTEFLKPDSAHGEQDYLWPIATADGKKVFFAVWKGSLGSAVLAVSSIDGAERKLLGLRGIRPLAVLGRTLVYVQDDGSVLGVKLNRSLDKTESAPVSVLDAVEVPANLNGNSEIFISSGGALVSSRGKRSSKLAWFGTDGSITPVSNEVHSYGAPRISPDEQTIAVSVGEQGTFSLWLYDLGNKTLSRLTSSSIGATSPEWSRDGKRVYFPGIGDDLKFGIFAQDADGGSEPRLLIPTSNPVGGLSISPDEKSLLYTTFYQNKWKIFQVDVADPKPKLYLNTSADEWAVTFSPDGKWIAMTSDAGGRDEIFIRSYPVPSARIQVSAGGGDDPRWAADGNSIYYATGTSLVKASLTRSPAMRVTARDTVAKGLNNVVNSALVSQYDITRSGRILGRLSDTGDYQIIAVPAWKTELDQKMAAAERH